MDVKIKNGDVVYDLNGNTEYVSGIEEMLQRALFSLNTLRGSFRYNRELGCVTVGRVTDSRSILNVQSKMTEAIANLPDVVLEVQSVENTDEGTKIGFSLKHRKDTIFSEVILP